MSVPTVSIDSRIIPISYISGLEINTYGINANAVIHRVRKDPRSQQFLILLIPVTNYSPNIFLQLPL